MAVRTRIPLVALSAVLGAATLASAPASSAATRFATYDAIVALDNCSGSLVRFPGAADTDKAVVLTNGHCIGTMPEPSTFVYDKAVTRSATVLGGSDAHTVTKLTLDRLQYATMTGTDVAVYRSTSTYAQLAAKNVTARPLAATHPSDETSIDIPSGYWKQHYGCAINGFVYQLKEGGYTMNDSIRYSTCQTPHGSSGSPIVDATSGTVIGINNTGNDDGERCTLDNPCEVDAAGNVSVHQGQSYGQQTYPLTACFTAGRIDLGLKGCTLFGATPAQPPTDPTPTPTPDTNLLVNGDFESGTRGWGGTTGAITTDVTYAAHGGAAKAWLGGNGRRVSESLSQSVTIPANAKTPTLTYWSRVVTAETGSRAYDTFSLDVVDGTSTKRVASASNLDASSDYVRHTVDLSAYKGRSVTLRFSESEDADLATSFLVDDVSVTAG